MENTGKPECKRKVILGNKRKLCGDPTATCAGGWCSNHCKDPECVLHNPTPAYMRR